MITDNRSYYNNEMRGNNIVYQNFKLLYLMDHIKEIKIVLYRAIDLDRGELFAKLVL